MTTLSLSHAAQAPDVAERIALVTQAEMPTFAELASRAARVRAALEDRGVQPGARVAVRARNDASTVVAVHALIDLGATIVPIHPRLTDGEISVVLADAMPTLVLTEDDLTELAVWERSAGPPARHDESIPLAIVYTSGTTGRPKGAVLSRRAFLASARGSEANLGWTEQDRWLMCMPVCHVGGLSIVTRCLLARRAVILVPRFDAEAVLETIARDRATLLSVVPTMLQALLERDRHEALRSLRAILVGGAATPYAVLRACEARGISALATYGLTEACSQVTVQRLASAPRARLGSGQPLDGVEVRVASSGHIQVRGATLMDGYFGGQGVPARASRDDEGWFDTGDLGEIDAEGALHVHARRTDLIVTGGENVYPVEVEQRLEAIDGIRQALVFGVRDDRWGQLVGAALVLSPGSTLDALAPAIADGLASHRRPRLVCVVDTLPTTASGKLERSGAADRYVSALRPFARTGQLD